jgi:hypothetical protein
VKIERYRRLKLKKGDLKIFEDHIIEDIHSHESVKNPYFETFVPFQCSTLQQDKTFWL